MTCHDIERVLPEWLGGALGAAEVVAIKAHASGCDRCRPLLGLVSESRSVFESKQSVPSPDLAARAFRAAMAAPDKAPSLLDTMFRWMTFATPVAVAAAVLLLVGAPSGSAGNAVNSSESKIDAASAILGDTSSWQAFSSSTGELP